MAFYTLTRRPASALRVPAWHEALPMGVRLTALHNSIAAAVCLLCPLLHLLYELLRAGEQLQHLAGVLHPVAGGYGEGVRG